MVDDLLLVGEIGDPFVKRCCVGVDCVDTLVGFAGCIGALADGWFCGFVFHNNLCFMGWLLRCRDLF